MVTKNNIFGFDWFLNRDELGKYNFDKSNAIFDFNQNTIAKILWGNKLSDLIKHPRNIEYELEGINQLINKDKYSKVTISDSDENEFYTDGENIVLSGKPLMDMGEMGMDILVGALIHESSHIRFTNFNLPKDKYSNNKFVHWIYNLIEDEVIEEMLQIEKPGLGNGLSLIKDYMFKDNSEPIPNDDLDIILYLLFAIIRYPKNIENITEFHLNDKSDLFKDIYNILKLNNVLNIKIKDNCSKENRKAAIEIYKLLSKKFDIKNIQNKFDENGEPSSKVLSGIKSTNIGKSISEAFNEKEADSIKQKVNKSPDLTSKKLNEQLNKQLNKESENTSDNESDNETENPNRGTQASKTLEWDNWNESDKNIYENIKTKYAQYIKLIENIQIKQKIKKNIIERTNYNRNGTLVGQTLINAYQGEKNVYSRFENKIGIESKNKFVLILALDESGSMSYKNIPETIQAISIIFYEALKKYPEIELFIYGHNDTLVNYINPNTKNPYILGKLRNPRGGQSEVLAYNTIIKDVLRQTNSEILLVNVTDSQYLSNYNEIENELKKWHKKINQSLIVLDNNLTNDDIKLNNSIYGINNWAHIIDINDTGKSLVEFKKIINYTNKLSKNNKRNKK